MEPKGKALKDDMTLTDLDLNSGAMLYFKDRGLQIGWTTVFLSEYAGPLLVYLWISTRPWLFYGKNNIYYLKKECILRMSGFLITEPSPKIYCVLSIYFTQNEKSTFCVYDIPGCAWKFIHCWVTNNFRRSAARKKS